MIGDIIFLSNFLSSNCKVLGGASASRCSSTPRLLLLHRLQLLQTSSTTIRWRIHNRTKTGLILLRSWCNFHRLPPPQGDMEECTITPRLIIINIHDCSVLSAHPADRFFLLRISDFQSRNKITWIQEYVFDILTWLTFNPQMMDWITNQILNQSNFDIEGFSIRDTTRCGILYGTILSNDLLYSDAETQYSICKFAKFAKHIFFM